MRLYADVGRNSSQNLDAEPSYLLVTRHPNEVAGSIHARGKLDPVISELLWLEHNADALLACRDRIAAIVDYQEWIDRPVEQARYMMERLDAAVFRHRRRTALRCSRAWSLPSCVIMLRRTRFACLLPGRSMTRSSSAICPRYEPRGTVQYQPLAYKRGGRAALSEAHRAHRLPRISVARGFPNSKRRSRLRSRCPAPASRSRSFKVFARRRRSSSRS